MKYRVVSAVHFIAPVYVSTNEECIVALSEERSLMGTCVASEDVIRIHVICVRRSPANMIRWNQEFVEILLYSDYWRKAVEDLELWLIRDSRTSFEESLDPVERNKG